MNDQLAIIVSTLRSRRKALHLTQKEAASRCGLKQANYSRLESGKQAPTLDTLATISEVLGLELRLFPCDVYTYYVMCRDELAAIVELSGDRQSILFHKILPDGMLQPFSGSRLDVERFYSFLKSRCYEDGRADLPEILKQAHLKDNNPYNFIRISHGVTYEDDFWIRFEGENLKWKDVRVR